MLAVLVHDFHGILMALRLERRDGRVLRGIATRMRPDGAVRGRVRASLVRLAACVLVLVAGVYQAFMADEEIASSERLGAYFADKRLFLRVGSYMSLQVLLLPRQLSAWVQDSNVARCRRCRNLPIARTVADNAGMAASWTWSHFVFVWLCQTVWCSAAHCHPL